MLLACAGGAFLNLIALLLFWLDATRLTPDTLAHLTVAFWSVNLGFLLLIRTGLNQYFRDPSLTLPQMLWATASVPPSNIAA